MMTPDYTDALLRVGKIGALTFIGAFGALFLLSFALM